ncbi:MAG: DsrE family protein [Serpentinimonas sp.]|nr:MAG: hypothetical protein JM57_06300 [Comamonadaceae bacterium BICA1-1]MDO8275212.1 DsrE family protein [Serpentinimonas sp.]
MLLWACEPEAAHRLATPFLFASAAAAMDMPVEVYFVARSVRLLVPGAAETLRAGADASRSIGELMQEAVSHGARFYACTEALRAQGLQGKPLIGACAGHGGAVQFMARAADPNWRTLVF